MSGLTLADVFRAQRAIRGHAARTPLVPSPYMETVAGQPFLLKMETDQPTGAFKLRGALNAILPLDADSCAGVTCCSTGNHGRGVAYAARIRGIRAVICMSSMVPEAKVDGIKAIGAETRIHGTCQDDAQKECLRLCSEEGLIEISPFDDPLVIAGQGTIGLEILEDCPGIDTLLIPLSGGGLAGGVAFAAKSIDPGVRVIGITMDRGACMKASVDAGHPVEVEEVPSLADSLGGGIGPENKLSFPLCRDYLDDIVLVTEEEIYDAIQTLYYEDRMVAEGGSVVGIAAMKAGRLPKPKGPVATIVTGRNVQMAMHAQIVAGESVRLGDLEIPGRRYVRT